MKNVLKRKKSYIGFFPSKSYVLDHYGPHKTVFSERPQGGGGQAFFTPSLKEAPKKYFFDGWAIKRGVKVRPEKITLSHCGNFLRTTRNANVC